ncbi:hypothetical protein KI387_011883 [Taxus chinensis]|uniref:Lipoxygenase domain-containing protein n=1 Tax=Taxus chinensis TaxID=29808 RepID=A0AA38CH68_TAXCH|nr:hypothetical protein KI387_011883 [Taxus chinensis]
MSRDNHEVKMGEFVHPPSGPVKIYGKEEVSTVQHPGFMQMQSSNNNEVLEVCLLVHLDENVDPNGRDGWKTVFNKKKEKADICPLRMSLRSHRGNAHGNELALRKTSTASKSIKYFFAVNSDEQIGLGMEILIDFHLIQALQKNKLFILDHHDSLMPYINRANGLDTTKTYASRTILFLKEDSTLKPVTI